MPNAYFYTYAEFVADDEDGNLVTGVVQLSNVSLLYLADGIKGSENRTMLIYTSDDITVFLSRYSNISLDRIVPLCSGLVLPVWSSDDLSSFVAVNSADSKYSLVSGYSWGQVSGTMAEQPLSDALIMTWVLRLYAAGISFDSAKITSDQWAYIEGALTPPSETPNNEPFLDKSAVRQVADFVKYIFPSTMITAVVGIPTLALSLFIFEQIKHA